MQMAGTWLSTTHMQSAPFDPSALGRGTHDVIVISIDFEFSNALPFVILDLAAANWPDLDEYKEWARITDTRDDAAIDQALAAATNAIIARCPVLMVESCPYEVQYATLLWTNRLLSRRNSPDGIVGVADLGIATVSRMDADIKQMLSPWLDQVVA